MSRAAARSVLVVDGDGQLVVSFADWDAAHRWSHLQASHTARQAAGLLPIRVEDLGRRRTLEVWADRCEVLQWVRAPRISPEPATCEHLRPVGRND